MFKTKLGQIGIHVAAVLVMAAVVAAIVAGCGTEKADSTGGAPARVAVTDQAGRSVTVPYPIETVYCASPMGTNLMYMLAPEMLVGWNITPTALEKKYIPEQLRGVVGLGVGMARTPQATLRRS